MLTGSKGWRITIAAILACTIWAAAAGADDAAPGDYSLVIAEDATTVTYRNADGQAVQIRKHAKRTVALLTSLLDLWIEAGGTAVGRNSTRQFVPEHLRNLPEVGSFANLNVERLLVLNPDLVISADLGNIRAVMPMLEANHTDIALFDYTNYYDYRAIFELFGKLNGTEARCRAALAGVQKAVDDIVGKVRGLAPPKVLIIFATPNIVNSELPNSNTGVMLEMLGGINIVAHARFGKRMRVNFSLERIVEMDPDLILVNTMGDIGKSKDRLTRDLTENAAWATLRAVRENRIHLLPKELFLYKPNADFPRSLQYLAAIMYPDAFPAGTAAAEGN
ncbi:MAG: ABC transporter substrate-binding protein [Pseudomonadota bacterium]